MKRSILLILILAALAVVSGHLMSKASWIGRVGMTFFHKEYNLLKIWWQGAAAVFVIFLVLFLLHLIIYQLLPLVWGRILHFVLLLAAGAGGYFTYDDFTNNFSHHALRWRFHYGFYLIWVGWALISIFFLFRGKRKQVVITDSDKTVITSQ